MSGRRRKHVNPYAAPENLPIVPRPHRGPSGTDPVFVDSVVAFFDLLGFKKMTQDAFKRGRARDLLKKISAALDRAAARLHSSEWAIKFFTDNVVLGYPVAYFTEGQSEINAVIESLGRFQLEISALGYFARGAIAVGEHYMDETLVMGDALLEAVAAESQIARDPRVVLTVSGVALVFDPYVKDEQRDFRGELLLKDADGQIFVNYLSAALSDLIDEDPENHERRFLALLEAHRESIGAALHEHAGDPQIWNKYLWAARYHNYWCTTVEHPTAARQALIELSKFEISFPPLPRPRRRKPKWECNGWYPPSYQREREEQEQIFREVTRQQSPNPGRTSLSKKKRKKVPRSP